MTDENNKLRAILLATLMVTSVFAGAIAFSGSAAAARGNLDAADETFNKTVNSGDTIFLGEDLVTDGGDLSGVQTLTENGDGNAVLDLTSPIPQDSDDQPLGGYSTDGNAATGTNLTLLQPRITDSEIQTPGGGDVTGATLGTDNADNLSVLADYNYRNAEQVEVTIEDPSGTDITGEVLITDSSNPATDGDAFIENNSASSPNNGGAVKIDMSGQDAGEYSIILEGTEDLDFGQASTTLTLGISSQTDVGIELESESATQGDDVQFTVNNGIDGDTHFVAIEASNIDDNTNINEVFRNVGDTNGATREYLNSTGGTVANAQDASVAIVELEIDGSSAVGSIETQFLDDGGIDVYVSNATATKGSLAQNPSTNSVDDVTLEVSEGDITLSSPTGTYVSGAEADINGTSSSADVVSVYVRDAGDWQLLEVSGSGEINVDSDDTFEEEDVQISTLGGNGSNILSQTGTYRIGVIDASDADQSSSNGNDADFQLSTSEFSSGTSTSESIRVTDQSLEGQFSTINGQVAPEDAGDTDVNGTAPGADTVAVIFVDNRGNAGYQQISVDDDGTFDESDVELDDVNGIDLSQGVITAHILSQGRDGTFGDGDDLRGSFSSDDGSVADLRSFVEDRSGGSADGSQVNELIAANTVEETASDDLIITQTFRLAESSTSIDTVRAEGTGTSGINPVAVGETMVISGTTNLEPDDNTINVEVTDSDGNSLALADTDEWNTNNGQYTLTIDTSDFETGTVTVEADDGDNTDVVNVEIVSERADIDTPEPEPDTPEPEPDTPEPDTDTPEPDTDTPEPDTATPEPETEEPTSTPTSTPGFGVVVALTALLAAALLAIRRD